MQPQERLKMMPSKHSYRHSMIKNSTAARFSLSFVSLPLSGLSSPWHMDTTSLQTPHSRLFPPLVSKHCTHPVTTTPHFSGMCCCCHAGLCPVLLQGSAALDPALWMICDHCLFCFKYVVRGPTTHSTKRKEEVLVQENGWRRPQYSPELC